MSVPRPDAPPAAAGSTGARRDARSGTEAPVWTPASAAEFAAPAAAADSVSEGVEPETEAVRSATANHVRRRAGSVTTLLAIAALVAVGGVAFAVGHATGGGTGSTGNTGNQGQFAPNGSFLPGGGPDDLGGARGAFGASLTGTVVSVTADSITLKLATGATVTIATSGSTTYHSQTAASSSDVAAGNTVTVQTSGSAAGANASPGTQSETQTATDVSIASK